MADAPEPRLTSIGKSFARVQLASVLGEEDVTSHGGDELFTLLHKTESRAEPDASREKMRDALARVVGNQPGASCRAYFFS